MKYVAKQITRVSKKGVGNIFFIFVATPKGVQGYVFIGLNQFTCQSSLQSLQIPMSRPARRSSSSQARI